MLYLIFTFIFVGLIYIGYWSIYIDGRLLFLKSIEFFLSISIIGILVSIAIPLYNTMIEKAINTKAIAEHIYPLKTEVPLYYAEHGYWPDDVLYESFKISTWHKNSSSQNKIYDRWLGKGQIMITRKENHQNLTIQAFIPKDKHHVDIDIVMWLCGYAQPDNLYHSKIAHKTNISVKQLPIGCK